MLHGLPHPSVIQRGFVPRWSHKVAQRFYRNLGVVKPLLLLVELLLLLYGVWPCGSCAEAGRLGCRIR